MFVYRTSPFQQESPKRSPIPFNKSHARTENVDHEMSQVGPRIAKNSSEPVRSKARRSKSRKPDAEKKPATKWAPKAKKPAMLMTLSSSLSRPDGPVKSHFNFGGGKNGPPKTNARRARKPTTSQFKKFYVRGDLPVTVSHGAKRKVQWKIDTAQLDYHHYLPLFLDGIRELEEPYKFISFEGTMTLLNRGGNKILPCVPQCIMPLKTALATRDPRILCLVMQVIQTLVQSADLVGEALVPYYRQLLPVFNLFISNRVNLGDQIDYGQRKKENLSDLIMETLELLEKYGGDDAFINIKYMIPTYESSAM